MKTTRAEFKQLVVVDDDAVDVTAVSVAVAIPVAIPVDVSVKRW